MFVSYTTSAVVTDYCMALIPDKAIDYRLTAGNRELQFLRLDDDFNVQREEEELLYTAYVQQYWCKRKLTGTVLDCSFGSRAKKGGV